MFLRVSEGVDKDGGLHQYFDITDGPSNQVSSAMVVVAQQNNVASISISQIHELSTEHVALISTENSLDIEKAIRFLQGIQLGWRLHVERLLNGDNSEN